MKRPDADHIENSEKFRIIHSLDYNQIVEFVFRYIKKTTFPSVFYFIINSLTVIILIYFLISDLIRGDLNFTGFMGHFFAGLLAGSILVIPLHEGFHGLAYKIAGAPKIHFGADLRQMIFYVTAHRYVLDRNLFYLVALAPFVMINLLALGIFLFSAWIEIHTLLFFLLFHNIMCIGDFAMISFFQIYKNRELYTFDDMENRISYIYEKLHDN